MHQAGVCRDLAYAVQFSCFETRWRTCMYGIPVPFSEPSGKKGLSRCSALPYVPPSLVQLGTRSGVAKLLSVSRWLSEADLDMQIRFFIHSRTLPCPLTDPCSHLYIAFRFPSTVFDRDRFPQSLTDAHIPREIFLCSPMFFTLLHSGLKLSPEALPCTSCQSSPFFY